METYTQIIGGDSVTREVPTYMNSVNVSNCPNLKWEFPSSWLAASVLGNNKGFILDATGSNGVTTK